jgi:Xaa-Pro dipeptidase
MAVVGKGTETQHKACSDIDAITRSTIDAIKPGITAADIVDICKSEYQKRGLATITKHETRGYGVHRKIGHGIGLTLSEAPQITTYDNTTIQPGMTFCIEPPITTTEAVYVVEQVAAVTRSGSEILSKADGGLYEISR